MLTQKLYRNGNSVVVTVPKEHLKDLGLRDGSRVLWRRTLDGLTLVPARVSGKKATQIDPQVARLIEKISKKYKSVWQDLARL